MQVHRNSSYVHIMPRSFLVRNYFRRKNYWINNVEDYEDQNTIKGQLSTSYTNTKVEHVGESRFSQSLDKRTWNYEEEKSYWFELSEKEGFFNLIETDVKGAWKVKKTEELADTPHVKRTELISQEKECKAIKKLPQPSTEQLLWENLEEKLNNMLDENPEIVKKNIKQFLENNRILVKEIAIETGLNEDCIHHYMEGNETFNEDQKRDFFQWYLLKILRPPNGSDEKSFTCYKCGKIFAYESYLERHIKYVCPDNTGRTWKCSYCGKAFQYPCYLRRHIRSHTGESPYKCDKCDRAFVRSTDLQRHIRNHTGEKPYKCSECERAFARSTDLKRHMRTHTGEKPYKCWQCGKTFSQSGSLQTHLHTHNKDGSTGRKLAKGSK